MKSKAVVLACLLLLSVLVFASAISEASQDEKAQVNADKDVEPIEESKQHCRYRCCSYYGGRCVRCCSSAAEAQAKPNLDAEQEGEVETTGYGGHGGKGHGGHGGGGKGGGGKGGRGGK